MDRLRVATFNLQSGRPAQGDEVRRSDLAAAAAALAADVVGLQEVDRGQPRSGGTDQTAAVAEALDAPYWRFVPTLSGTPGPVRTWTVLREDGGEVDGPTYGIGTVSRLPVQAWYVRRFGPAPFRLPLVFPVDGRPRVVPIPDEPRAALAAVVEGPRGPMTVVNAHLSFVPGYNLRQLRALVRWARTFPGPRLLIGDLNLPGSLPRLVSGWPQLGRLPTYPAGSPRVQFDHVLADGIAPAAVTSVAAPRMAISDHLPLVVDLAL